MRKLWLSIILALLSVKVLYGSFSYTFDTTTPTKTSVAKDIDIFIRNYTKYSLYERLVQDHHFVTVDSTASDTVGWHKAIHLLLQDSTPSTDSRAGILYEALNGDTSVLYIKTNKGVVLPLTNVKDTATSRTLDGDTYFDYADFCGLDSYVAPTSAAEFTPKSYVDSEIIDGGNDIITALDAVWPMVTMESASTDTSTSSITYEDMLNMTHTATYNACNILVTFKASITLTDDTVGYARLLVDDVEKDMVTIYGIGDVGTVIHHNFTLMYAGAVTAASHTIHVEWKAGAGTIYQYGTAAPRKLIILSNLN